VQLGPHAPYTVPLEDMKKIVDIAKTRGIGLHFHFLETEWELEYIRNDLKMEPNAYLREIGIFEVPGAVLAHGVWMSPAWAEPAEPNTIDMSRSRIVLAAT